MPRFRVDGASKYVRARSINSKHGRELERAPAVLHQARKILAPGTHVGAGSPPRKSVFSHALELAVVLVRVGRLLASKAVVGSVGGLHRATGTALPREAQALAREWPN